VIRSPMLERHATANLAFFLIFMGRIIANPRPNKNGCAEQAIDSDDSTNHQKGLAQKSTRAQPNRLDHTVLSSSLPCKGPDSLPCPTRNAPVPDGKTPSVATQPSLCYPSNCRHFILLLSAIRHWTVSGDM